MAAQQAVPVVGPKLVNATNALYQHMDLAPVMTRLMSLAQSNFVGLFPGSNPYGFQADPNTFCLFAVPKDGTPDPASQLVSPNSEIPFFLCISLSNAQACMRLQSQAQPATALDLPCGSFHAVLCIHLLSFPLQNSWLQRGQQSADGVADGITSAANSLPSSLPEMPSQLPTLPTTSLYNAFGAYSTLM